MHRLDILENGLKVASQPMEHMESVSIGVWIRAGSRDEETKNNGISHLLEHLVFKGTKKRDMKRIKEEIEGRGGSFNGFTTEEFTCYLVKVLSKDTELGVDILSDMVLNPRLDQEELEKEKKVIVDEINMYKDIPSHHVHEILTEMLWPDQPLGLPLAGTPESVNAASKSALVVYRDTYYSPKNMLLVGAGKVGVGELISISEKYFLTSLNEDAPKFKKAQSPKPGPRLNLNFKETEQTHVALGLHALKRHHPDRYVLTLLNIILGANMSSRLFHIVRDELALCYEVSSGVRRYEDTGALVVSAGVDAAKLVSAIEVILREVSRMKSEPVVKEELNRAKEYYKGQLLFALEDTMSYMLWLGEKIIAGEKEFDIKKILGHIEDVNEEDLMRIASDIFKDENLNLAIIGPTKEEKQLKEALHLV